MERHFPRNGMPVEYLEKEDLVEMEMEMEGKGKMVVEEVELEMELVVD